MASMDAFITSLLPSWTLEHYPNASSLDKHIPIYDGHYLRQLNEAQMLIVREEWVKAWLDGAGVIVVKHLYSDLAPVQAMTEVIVHLLDQQNSQTTNRGDHFAPSGVNGRLWNSFEKAGRENPSAFIHYYKNPLLAQICQAWLGPDYRMTAQANLVYPGGQAQSAHRDYHLGFYTPQQLTQVPRHVQVMSSMLTLQGAIAHTDIPIVSGSTMFLPYSQRYEEGYSLYHQQALQDYFFANAVQLPLQEGDGVFFNPAIMHAAGANKTKDINRLANLLQVVSRFSIAMESLNLAQLQINLLDTLKSIKLTNAEQEAILTAMSDSNPFPVNMDRNPPSDTLMPRSGRDLLQQALAQNWDKAKLSQALQNLQWCKISE